MAERLIMSVFDQLMMDLKQPLAANSPVPPKATSSALPFTTLPSSSPINPATSVIAPAAPSSKWMMITLIGALAFGLWYMGGGLGLGGGSTAASTKRRGRGRRRVRSVRSSRKRRVGRRRSRSRKKVTFGR